MMEKLREIAKNDSPARKNLGIFGVYKSLVCKHCNKSFEKKTAFQSHVKSHEFDDHTYESKRKPLDKYKPHICNICENKFTAKKNLLKHLRVIHKNPNEAEKLKVKKTRCPVLNCLFACRKMGDLRLHIEKHHEIKILKDTLQFTNEADFLKWKKEEEDNSFASFVSFRRKCMLRNGTIKKVLLCHRTGHYSPKGTGKHRLKSHGSCKIGGKCPAAMEMVQGPDGHITVIYYKTHIGHSQDVIHLQLSREDRAKLSERIQQGFSLDAILEDVKESIQPGTGKTKRIHLLSRKDLYNIMQSNNSKKTKHDETDINTFMLKEEVKNEDISVQKKSVDKKSDISKAGGITQGLNTDGVFFQKETVTEMPETSETLNKTTSQLVIVSPNIGYIPAVKPAVIPANPSKILQKGKGVSPKNLKTNAAPQSPLPLKLNEKIQKLGQMLPKAEFLTPKQYEIINAKLDSIIFVLNSVNAKAKSKKMNFKKTDGIRDENEAQESENVGIECLLPASQNVQQQQQQQVYDTPLYAYVFNYN